MKEAGQVVVFRFPQADLEEGKLRPALRIGFLKNRTMANTVSMKQNTLQLDFEPKT